MRWSGSIPNTKSFWSGCIPKAKSCWSGCIPKAKRWRKVCYLIICPGYIPIAICLLRKEEQQRIKKEELELWRQHQDIQRRTLKVTMENTEGAKLYVEGDMNEVMSMMRNPTFIQETGLVPGPEPRSIQEAVVVSEPRSSKSRRSRSQHAIGHHDHHYGGRHTSTHSRYS